MLLALCIFALTLILIMVRPKHLNEAMAASLGAVLMVATGVVSPIQAFEVLKTSANVLLFFLGLMLVSRLKLNPLLYVFACAFVANTASLVLPVSNPVNLLPVDRFGLTLGEYLLNLL